MTDAREKVLATAKELVGTGESPPGSNHNRFTEWYGLDGPWCAMFVSWVFHHSGMEKIPRFAYTPSFAEWFRGQNAGFTDDADARAGDVVFFNFPDSLDRIQHIGFVVDNKGGTLTTIEGNTSSGAAGSQDDGGGVAVRTRGYGEAVYYGRPDYNGKPEKPEFVIPVKAWFGPGDKGADVKTWQRDLNKWVRDLNEQHPQKTGFSFEIDADGTFGPQTKKATLTFQGFYELDADGRVGPHTLEKMENVRRRQRAKGDG